MNQLLIEITRILHISDSLSNEPDKTTTIGDPLPVRTIKPFQIINAEETIIAKFST